MNFSNNNNNKQTNSNLFHNDNEIDDLITQFEKLTTTITMTMRYSWPPSNSNPPNNSAPNDNNDNNW